MDNKTLRLHEENCVWMLDEEESTEQIVAKAVPSYLWKVADYIDSVGTWQGTATELLSAADIEGVLPHQLTRKIVEHFDTVFTPRGIRYETHRTSQARQMKFSHDGNDADDANDADIDITQLFKWDISQTASSASLASQRLRKESKHGRSVATGQPAEKPTGTAPNPCEAAERMRKRSVGINVRVSVTEKRKMTLMAKRCGLSLSEYLRQRALGYEPGGHPPKEVFDVLDKLDEIAEKLFCTGRGSHEIGTSTDRMRDLLIGSN